MCLEKREGGPLYRNKKGGKSHIKPMWDSYLTKSNNIKFSHIKKKKKTKTLKGKSIITTDIIVLK